MAKLKGNMSKGYSMHEIVGLYIEYMEDFNNVNHNVWDVDEHETLASEVLEGNGCIHEDKTMIHVYEHIFIHYVAQLKMFFKR